jgi:hypothetical protein
MVFERKNQRWQIDFKGPLQKKPHQLYVFFIIDRFDMFVWSKAFLTKDPSPVSTWTLSKFEEVGCPEEMQSDNGNEVKNAMWKGKI